jgi:hypothetical protein
MDATEKCTVCSGIQARIHALESDNGEQWEAINALRNRLPPWATFTISLLTFLCGVFVTVAVKG